MVALRLPSETPTPSSASAEPYPRTLFIGKLHVCVPKSVLPSSPYSRKKRARRGDLVDGKSGVYVAGDASRDVLLVAVAIAEGAKAAVAINRALLKDEGLG